MAFRVEPTAQAHQDLDGILEWLLEQGAGEAGLRWIFKLEDAIASLPTFRTVARRHRRTRTFLLKCANCFTAANPSLPGAVHHPRRHRCYSSHPSRPPPASRGAALTRETFLFPAKPSTDAPSTNWPLSQFGRAGGSIIERRNHRNRTRGIERDHVRYIDRLRCGSNHEAILYQHRSVGRSGR